MSILTKIDGRPLFNSKWKAERWGKRFGITGTHTHVHSGQIGWMAGDDHGSISKVFKPRKRVLTEKLDIGYANGDSYGGGNTDVGGNGSESAPETTQDNGDGGRGEGDEGSGGY